MTDLIVFSVGTNRYAMDIENVQRIIQATELTEIPNSHEYVDGMMSYEGDVIKVMNFRKLIHLETYDNELKTLFLQLKSEHSAWVEALRSSIETDSEFTKTLNPHACELGKWIDSFTAYDDSVLVVLNELIDFHKQLHVTGGLALETCKTDKEEALRILNVDVNSIYGNTMEALDTFVKELDLVSNSLQKFIIYDNNGDVFAIKVDTIEDIAHVENNEFIKSEDENNVNEFLELDSILDLNSVLVNVIKTVKIPS